MIYKVLYDKLKACSIDDNSDNDIVLRLNTQYTTLFECLNKTYFHSHKVCESKQNRCCLLVGNRNDSGV